MHASRRMRRRLGIFRGLGLLDGMGRRIRLDLRRGRRGLGDLDMHRRLVYATALPQDVPAVILRWFAGSRFRHRRSFRPKV